MPMWNSEQDARREILDLVAAYYHTYQENRAPFRPGDRISYAGRVFDEKEMCALVDASLDFWLTAGRFAAAAILPCSTFSRMSKSPQGKRRLIW